MLDALRLDGRLRLVDSRLDLSSHGISSSALQTGAIAIGFSIFMVILGTYSIVNDPLDGY